MRVTIVAIAIESKKEYIVYILHYYTYVNYKQILVTFEKLQN